LLTSDYNIVCNKFANNRKKEVAISRNLLVFKALQDGLEPTPPWLTVVKSGFLWLFMSIAFRWISMHYMF